MMACKAALTEADGNFEEANTILRKRGLASAAKKAGRTASEGLIANAVAADHSWGILAEVNCESDFVARTPDFQQLMRDVLAEIEKAGGAANDAWLKDPQGPIVRRAAPVIAKLGENMAVSRFVRYAGQGYVGQYIHQGGKIGVMVEIGGVTPAIAKRDEQDRRDEEHPVRFELSRHPLQLDCVCSDNFQWTDATIVLAPPKP